MYIYYIILSPCIYKGIYKHMVLTFSLHIYMYMYVQLSCTCICMYIVCVVYACQLEVLKTYPNRSLQNSRAVR